MNIYYLSHSFIPSTYANSIQVMQMCQAFKQNDHDVTLFAKSGNEDIDDDFQYYGLSTKFSIVKSKKPEGLMGGMWYVQKTIKKIKNKGLPDLFYGRDQFSLWTVSCLLKRPVILEAHSSPLNVIERTVQSQLFKNSNFVRLVCISKSLKKEYLKIFSHLKEEKIIVAPDGANILSSSVSSIDNWPGRKGTLQIGYTGHLYKGKGLEIIVPLAQKLTDVDFHIVGGKAEHLACWKEKSKNIDNLYFHGFCQPSVVSHYLDKFDIVLAPYQKHVIIENIQKADIAQWTSPLKIFEYMAARKAIIASNLPVLKEVLSDDQTALLVDPDNLMQWIHAIDKLRDSSNRERLGNTAQKIFRENYTWKKRALNVLESIS